MLDFIAKPMGQLLLFIYNHIAFGSYGLSIIIFTIIVKSLLLPLTVKQLKSSAKMKELQPQIAEIQRKYKNDKEKLNQEIMKFYKETGFNPAGGCLPILIQMPILFALFYVIGKPLTYMFNMSASGIADLIAKVPLAEKVPGFYEQIGAVSFHNVLNMNFLGLHLGLIPTFSISKLFYGAMHWQYLALLVIPIVATITTFLSTKLSMMASSTSNSNTQNKEANMADSMQKNMMYIAPILTLIVSFQFPAGLGLYWIIGNVFQIFQQMFLNKFVLKTKKKEVAIE